MPPPEGDAVTADGIVRGGLSNNDFERGSVRGDRWWSVGLHWSHRTVRHLGAAGSVAHYKPDHHLGRTGEREAAVCQGC